MMSKKEQIEALNKKVEDLEEALDYKDMLIEDYRSRNFQYIELCQKFENDKRRFEIECMKMSKFLDENPDIRKQYEDWKDKRKKDIYERIMNNAGKIFTTLGMI